VEVEEEGKEAADVDLGGEGWQDLLREGGLLGWPPAPVRVAGADAPPPVIDS
jgi:hypothetical protein